MNRKSFAIPTFPYRVPRTRGDEPAEATAKLEVEECSPHTRG